MGLSSEMKTLSEEVLASFKQRIKENEELVNEVKETLNGFQKDNQEMAATLKANAVALKKGLALGEKERLNTYHELMTGINHTMASIQKEVVAIQTSTLGMIKTFKTDRVKMAEKLKKSFTEGNTDRMKDEKIRMEEFDALMKNINADIKSINDEVLAIFKDTDTMLDTFEKDHLEMSTELRTELSKNLAERVNYTRKTLNEFQKRLSEISKENQKMAQKLRKNLAKGETERLDDYNVVMKKIHSSIIEIRKEVKNIQKATVGMIGNLSHSREQGAAEWNNMLNVKAQLRKKSVVKPVKEAAKNVEIKEVKIETPVVAAIKTPVVAAIETPVEVQPKAESKPVIPMTLEQKILDYINKHPKGVKISEMEVPLGETRMKLGFVAKNLLDEGKIRKIENVYLPQK